MKKIFSVFLLGVLITSLNGCSLIRTKEPVKQTVVGDAITLVYYKLFDNKDVFEPLIQKYQTLHPNVKIKYRKFTDATEYEDLIINELAEGEGPDIFSLHNTWMPKHWKKLAPMPEEIMNKDTFEKTFVSVARRDFVRPDKTGLDKVFALPLTVDTLALYYNKDHYEDAVPSRGMPPATWEELKDDVFKLTKKDNSFERFHVAGVALGRADNISRAADILYLLFLQHKIPFYSDNFTKAVFADTSTLGVSGKDALELYTSFAKQENKYYSWNQYIANPLAKLKEVESFAKGKVSMIFGYSYLYEDIKNIIKERNSKGFDHIKESSVKVAPAPQLFNPKTSTEKREAYSSYFAETVSRTSAHQKEAWDFLNFLTSKENLAHYHAKTHKPTSRRDMIENQEKEPIYGVFAKQIGYASSFVLYDPLKYEDIFAKAIDAVVGGMATPDGAIQEAQREVNKSLPEEGLPVKLGLNIKPLVEKTEKTPNN